MIFKFKFKYYKIIHFFLVKTPPVMNLIIFLNNFTCFYKIFTFKIKHFVDNVYPQYLKILLHMVTLLVCYCFLVPLSDWSKNAMDHSMAIENGSSILSYRGCLKFRLKNLKNLWMLYKYLLFLFLICRVCNQLPDNVFVDNPTLIATALSNSNHRRSVSGHC